MSMTVNEVIRRLQELKVLNSLTGDEPAVIDTGMCLCIIDEVDLGASDEGVIIWAGDLAEG